MKRHLSHGEVNLFEVDGIPSTAKRVDLTTNPAILNLLDGAVGFKIADSETTGNHHLVKLNDQIALFEDTDGTLYIRNLTPTTVECVDTARHDTCELPPSTWKRDVSREFDHLEGLLRRVAD